jgi:cyanosortase A-associated protein
VQDESGSRGLYVQGGRVYLSTCLAPTGVGTFTPRQFGREVLAWQLRNLLPWFVAQVAFPNRHCLWLHLSVPARPGTERTLETVWPGIWVAWRGYLERR